MESYYQLASLMQAYPNLLIFRTFIQAKLHDLLVLQAELINVDAQLDLQVTKDYLSTDYAERKQFAQHIKTMKEAEGGESAQWLLILERRELLSKFSRALQEIHFLLRLPKPASDDVETLQSWLMTRRGGNGFQSGEELTTWQDPDDLAALADEGLNKDIVSQFVHGKLMPWCFEHLDCRRQSPTSSERAIKNYPPSMVEKNLQAPLVVYSDQTLSKVITILSTSLSSLLPIFSVVALYFAQSDGVRLGLTIVFTFLFSIAMSVVTHGKRAECFAATAAFAAVLVVFVGGTNQQIRTS